MRKSAGTLALLALLASASVVLRAEDKPTPDQARKAFQTTDTLLNKTYKETCAGLDKTKLAALRDAERDWIVYRDQMIDADFGDDTAKRSADYWEAMGEYAKDRIEFLRAWAGKNMPPGITGEYSDSYGATLELDKGKDGIDFDITAVRGRGHNEGEIGGTLHPKDGKAYFKEELDPGQEGPPCELFFTFAEGHIVRIEQKNSDPVAGHNVSYGGDYYKTGKAAAHASTPAPVATATPVAVEKPTVEQTRKTFENTDNLLTVAYKEAGSGLDQTKMTDLRQKERDWIQYRETLAKSAPYFNSGSQTDSPKGTVDYWQTMDGITRARVDFLRAYSGKGLPAGLAGVYCDSYGGTLELEERKSGLFFSINTVRGMARNKGHIEGVAERTGDKGAAFKDHPDAGDDRTSCEIDFTFIEGHIVKVEEKNGDFYHGPNANFDGTYYKTGKLEKPPRPE